MVRINRWSFALIPIALIALCWLAVPRSAAAQDATAPVSCRVGAYVTSINSLDFADGTYAIEAWLWSVCPVGVPTPLDTMEFVNADSVTSSLESTEDRGGEVWSSRKIAATVRQPWNLANFPFDAQTLELRMEEAGQDVSGFVYEADTANTGYDAGMKIKGWKIDDFALEPSTATYTTTYGDPALEAGGTSQYSRLTLKIGIDRAELSSFFKLTAIVYAAFLLALISFFLYLGELHPLSSQMGLLAGALFAAAINMRNATSTLGSEGGMTLVDKIHILVLGYILAAGVVAVISSLLINRGREQPAVARMNYRLAAVAAATFVAANALLIGQAVSAG